ncbi:hypothetical protein [Pseudonocardia spinosispora]|uniref:hypothetical protein n=1 Tax=Pseudonocardia spinosispora TaxID=103441 RepID=UPI0012ECA2DC|nr:hypothetical protein [Pseudonocardia spinosispora]
MRQRRPPGPKTSPLGPLHHRGLWSQIIGGLIVAGVLAVVGLVWNSSPAPGPPPVAPTEAAKTVVGQLSTGVSLSRYEQLLGGPPAILRPANAVREAVWVADLYAVQALVGPLDQVLGYSVTTRSPAFTPPLERLDQYRLGVARFGDIPEILGTGDSTLVSSSFGPRGDWFYSETIPASGATHDDTIALTSSDASDIDSGLTDAGLPGIGLDGKPELVSVTDPRIAGLRPRLVVTTYTVLGPQLDPARLPEEFRFGASGADIDAVHPPH